MKADGIAVRTRAGLAALRRSTPDAPQRLSRWAWAADVILAVFLAAATVTAAWQNAPGDRPGPPLYVPSPVVPRPPMPPTPPYHPGFGDAVRGVDPGGPVPFWLLVLAALVALPLVMRRRYPVAAYGAVMSATLAFHFSARHAGVAHYVDDATVFTFVSCLIAGYSAAVYSPYRQLGAAALLTGAVVVTVFHDMNLPVVTPSFVPFVILVPIGLAANTIHSWRQRLRSLEGEQETATRLAVDRERARIARELHDVVTHNVSVMTVQAGAARTVLASAPEQAREALLAVEAAGRDAMSELRHVMGLLAMTSAADGDDPAAAELAPQPGLSQVSALADRVRGTGVPVELIVTGVPTVLPAGPDLAAYRVVQEALTNTVKHAAGAGVKIAVEHRPGEVRIEVADTGAVRSDSAGPGPGAWPGVGSGRGLIGLRERLAVYGGTLDAGSRLTGGFRVRAVIPVEDGGSMGGGTLMVDGSGTVPAMGGGAGAAVGDA